MITGSTGLVRKYRPRMSQISRTAAAYRAETRATPRIMRSNMGLQKK